MDATAVRNLVRLAVAADYLELVGLVRQCERAIRCIISQNPLLACPLLDESEEGSPLYDCARRMIRTRPYVSLLPPVDDASGGGVECLGKECMIELLKDEDIEAGELFLFEMLQRWVEHAPEDNRKDALNVARQCARYFRLHYIEPEELLSRVQTSGLFPPQCVVEAMMRQALAASQNRVWSSKCRGPNCDADRVLVEGSGHREVNGMHHRILGLINGDVYSKYEVACGQMNVYALTCSLKDGMVESRIFCSKVLTHRAIPTLQTPSVFTSPIFQPVLQVFSVESPKNRQWNLLSIDFCQLHLSDGDYFMRATLAEELTGLDLVEHSLVQILDCTQCACDNKFALHIRNLSVVSSGHPGHVLGNPMDVSPRQSPEEGDASAVRSRINDGTESNGDGLQKFHSCCYPVDQKSKDTNIPRTGWSVEEHGVEPAPRCALIAATGRQVEEHPHADAFPSA